MPEGRRFEPGQSGNPRGRPKGIARTVRELTSAEERVQVLLTIADDEKERTADRLKANELLLAYGYGKPPMFAAIEGADPLERDEVTEAIAGLVDELSKRRSAPA